MGCCRAGAGAGAGAGRATIVVWAVVVLCGVSRSVVARQLQPLVGMRMGADSSSDGIPDDSNSRSGRTVDVVYSSQGGLESSGEYSSADEGAEIPEFQHMADLMVLGTSSVEEGYGSDEENSGGGSNERIRLDICECEPATGSPHGLSCSKEGFFVASFERQGQWLAGGGAVPLSRAVCCRPCMPKEKDLPDGMDGAPLGVVSIGCHASVDGVPVRCEEKSNSFVSGFTNSMRVFAPGIVAYYPVDNAECCVPSLLLDTGDVVDIERCDCGKSTDGEAPVNCGGNDTHTLLTGFETYRRSPTGHVIPVERANCCHMCVSGKRHSIHDCEDLGYCHGHGVCIIGRCECFRGWGASDCSTSSGTHGDDIPAWAITLIVIGSCIVGVIFLGLLAYLAELIADWRSQNDADSDDDEDSPYRTLLIRMDRDDEASVGSQDTDGASEEEPGDVEERIRQFEQELQEAAEGEEQQASESIHIDDGENEGNVTSSDERGNDESAAVRDGRHQSPPLQVDGLLSSPKKADEEVRLTKPKVLEGPLGDVACTVCLDRPVQVVAVPCGHACMCRRCCRRLKVCPICRCVVARRQRLFV